MCLVTQLCPTCCDHMDCSLPGSSVLGFSYIVFVTKSCLTPVTPWSVACQALLSIGFSRQEYLSGLPWPIPGGSSQPRDQIQVSLIAGRFFTIWAIRKTPKEGHYVIIKGSIQGEDTTLVNIYEPNIEAS